MKRTVKPQKEKENAKDEIFLKVNPILLFLINDSKNKDILRDMLIKCSLSIWCYMFEQNFPEFHLFNFLIWQDHFDSKNGEACMWRGKTQIIKTENVDEKENLHN